MYKLWRMYFQYGYFKPLVAIKVGGVSSWRQIIPPLFTGALLISLILSFMNKYFFYLFFFIIGLYIVVNFAISLLISLNKKDLRFLPFLMSSFMTMHVGYGLGYLNGIWDFIFFKKHLKGKIEDISLTR